MGDDVSLTGGGGATRPVGEIVISRETTRVMGPVRERRHGVCGRSMRSIPCAWRQAENPYTYMIQALGATLINKDPEVQGMVLGQLGLKVEGKVFAGFGPYLKVHPHVGLEGVNWDGSLSSVMNDPWKAALTAKEKAALTDWLADQAEALGKLGKASVCEQCEMPLGFGEKTVNYGEGDPSPAIVVVAAQSMLVRGS